MTPDAPQVFLALLREYYAVHGRHDMAWRAAAADGLFDPYKILVSELMLQQTQVARVEPKFRQFIEQFPKVHVLAAAPLSAVLQAWNGLGYNRRAQYLHAAAGIVVHKHAGIFSESYQELITLPGVGPNTAGAILAYAYNLPVVYIETNIRTVIIYHFYQNQTGVTDQQIRAIVERLLALAATSGWKPREFYWALMDYGSHLKQTVGNLSRASKSYNKQSKFAGSQRQLRGAIIRLLSKQNFVYNDLAEQLDDPRTDSVLEALTSEGLIAHSKDVYRLA